MMLLLRHAIEDFRDGDAPGATQRLTLAVRSCEPTHCSAGLRGRIHMALGAIAAHSDAAAASQEFAAALAADPHATIDPELTSSEAQAALAQARGGGGGGAAHHAQLGDACSDDTACGDGMRCTSGSCADAESPTGSSPSHAEATSSEAPASAAPASDAAATWRFAIDAGGGLGLPFIGGGMPEYEEFREWDMRGSGNFTCGAMGELNCPTIVHPRFGYEGVVVLGIRYNLAPRVGLGLSVRIQPDAAPVGILSSLFFGARLYISLTDAGFVKRGLAVSTFIGTGVGQMQASPPGDAMVAHIISGLNNFHAGMRFEYGLGYVGLGAELSLNFQIPNFLFVPDLTAFVSLHF